MLYFYLYLIYNNCINFRPYVCFFNNTFINDDENDETKPRVSCLTPFIRTIVLLVSISVFNYLKIILCLVFTRFKKILLILNLFNIDGTKY